MPSDDLILHRCIEAFLTHEARLIDTWQLDAWLGLFTRDCTYEITPTSMEDPECLSPDTVLFIVSDDRFMLEQRVRRLGDDATHSERPKSHIMHLLGNIEIRECVVDKIVVASNSLVFRSRREVNTLWASTNLYELARDGSGIRIRSKRVMLANDALVASGMGILSSIL